jgi:hypothetical protein
MRRSSPVELVLRTQPVASSFEDLQIAACIRALDKEISKRLRSGLKGAANVSRHCVPLQLDVLVGTGQDE